MFRIEATITDDMSGVASAFVYLNGQLYPMSAEGDIYGAEVPHSKGVELDYYILAYDGAGNEAIWNPTRGYITRGTFGSSLGIPPWAFYMGKNKVGNAIPSARAGSRPCSQFCGDPINTSNGNLYDEMELLKIAGRPEIKFNINYNSQGAGLSIFGENWNHSYNYHLTYMDNSVFSGALVQYPDGRQVMFEGDNLTPESGNFEILEKTGDGFTLTYKDQTEVYFDAEGDIERWEDENDNGLNFVTGENLEGANLTPIHSITADGGRSVTFNYSKSGLVSQIDTSGEITLKFEYDENDDLVKYTDADGGEYKFSYSNHDIIKKLSPKGHAIYENTFDDLHRVTKQIAGDGFVQEYSYENTESGSQATVKDGRGTIATYSYTDEGTLDNLLDESGKRTKHEYDDKKQVTKTTDAGGKVTNYEYDESGNVTKQTDTLGKSIEREYDETFSKPTYEKFKEDGKETRFEYDNKGNLTKVTNALGDESKFVYDDHGQLKLSQDFNGNKILYYYTDEGDLERIVDARGKAMSYQYDELGRKVKETDKNGNIYKFEYDDNSNLTKVSGPKGYALSYVYDDNNHLIKEVDANGGEKKYEYSADENLVRIIDELGHETKYEYGEMNELLKEIDAESRETLYGYSERYELTDMIQAAGSGAEAKTTFGYDNRRQQTEVTDAEGRVGKQEYDPLYRLSKKIEDATGISAETTYTYSDSGAITGEVDANGNATTYKYDLLDRITETIDAESNTTKSEYDANGNVTKRTNARGHETTFSYDPLNRITKIRDAKGGETFYEYDANSNLVSERDPKERFTTYKYDELNRLTEEVVNFKEDQEADSETNVTTSYVYDLHGNMTKLINARGNETSFSYDAAHRNTKITDAHGKKSNYIYDKVGNLLKATDRNGNTTNSSFDELNRVVQSVSAEDQKVNYGYDRVGNRVRQIDARGGNYTTNYDGLNRAIKNTDPLGGSSTYGYDNVGNLTAQADENGHTTNYNYDAVYRTTGITNPEGHSQAISYDKNGNVIKAVDANGNETKYAYDELDRLTETIDALEGESTTSYDSVGNVLSETDENGHTTTYTFDKQYRINKVTDAEGHETEFSYDATGNRVRVIDGNENETEFSYDDLDRLTEIVNAESEKNAFGYDNEGNKTSETAPDGIVKASNYDRVYRLVTVVENFKDGEDESEDRNIDTNYGYDANNNLVSMQNANDNATRFEYDPLNRQIKEIDAEGNSWSFGYDAVSNRTVRVDANGNSTNYSYYADDQLKTVSYYDSTNIRYSYDPNNNAVEMQDSIGRTNWNYDALDRVTAVDDALGQVLNHTYDSVDNRTGLSYQDGKQQSFSYYKNNWLESMTDPEGGVVSYERDGVGNTVKINNPNLTVSYLNYDKVYRTKEITNYSGKDVNSKFSYDYNSAGFRTQIEADYAWRKPAKLVTNYEYDGLRRLTESTTSEGIVSSYGYDRVGNRLRYATNDVGTSSKPFDAFEQDSSYNKINQVQQILETGKGGKGKGKSQYANVSQALYALEHELLAQSGKHITEKAAAALLEQTQALIAELESGTNTTEDIQINLDSLKTAIESARDNDGIDSDGIETSLLAKIQRAGEFNVDTGKGNTLVKELESKIFSYDANGNRVNKKYPGPQGPQIQGENYTYDPEDRLASVENYQGKEQNGQGNKPVTGQSETDPNAEPEAKTILRHITVEKYDGRGRRLIKEYDNKAGGGGNKIQHYTYDNLDPVSVKQTWNSQHSNLYRTREAGQSRIAMAQNFAGPNTGTQGQSYWYHYDALGSVAGLTKHNGQSDHNYRYDDFGQITPQSGASGNTSGGNFTAPHNSFTYTGQEFDEHIGLYEFYNRAYDPEVGVWLQQDDYRGELPQPMSQHRYMYVNNSPANYWDEYGYNPGMGVPYMQAQQKHYEQQKAESELPDLSKLSYIELKALEAKYKNELVEMESGGDRDYKIAQAGGMALTISFLDFGAPTPIDIGAGGYFCGAVALIYLAEIAAQGSTLELKTNLDAVQRLLAERQGSTSISGNIDPDDLNPKDWKKSTRTDNEKYAFDKLSQKHGVSKHELSNSLHEMKSSGLGGADNVIFDIETGSVWIKETGAFLGNLL